MARGINKVILIGNLGKDPETRFTPQGTAVSNFSVATDESYKDGKTGQIVPRTEWHNVACFNRLAEIARDYLKKGSKVYIEGRLQTRKWQDKNGQDRYTTEIIAGEMQMLDGKGGGSGSSGGGYDQQHAPASTQHTQSAPAQASSYSGGDPGYASAPAPMGDFDDDIPF